MIKSMLEKANRYDDVTKILFDIILSDDQQFPVNPFVNNDKELICNINGNLVREEALRLLRLIANDKVDPSQIYIYPNLSHYISTKLNTLLHNYAVSVSLRNEPKENMETIRILCILENLIYSLDIGIDGWYIPDG